MSEAEAIVRLTRGELRAVLTGAVLASSCNCAMCAAYPRRTATAKLRAALETFTQVDVRCPCGAHVCAGRC